MRHHRPTIARMVFSSFAPEAESSNRGTTAAIPTDGGVALRHRIRAITSDITGRATAIPRSPPMAETTRTHAAADKPRLVGINHVAIEVGDIDAALEFYGKIFDFTLRA